MATMTSVAEGLTILAKYDEDGTVRAEHDELYAGPDHDALEADDLARLDELGWTFDPIEECWRRFTSEDHPDSQQGEQAVEHPTGIPGLRTSRGGAVARVSASSVRFWFEGDRNKMATMTREAAEAAKGVSHA